MIAKMALAPDTGDLHVSWVPDREQRSGVAASVRGISKRFKKSRVLEDINFDVAEGESLVLLGASGSGKTTILRIIAGLEQPDSGYVILHGKDVTDLPARFLGGKHLVAVAVQFGKISDRFAVTGRGLATEMLAFRIERLLVVSRGAALSRRWSRGPRHRARRCDRGRDGRLGGHDAGYARHARACGRRLRLPRPAARGPAARGPRDCVVLVSILAIAVLVRVGCILVAADVLDTAARFVGIAAAALPRARRRVRHGGGGDDGASRLLRCR